MKRDLFARLMNAVDEWLTVSGDVVGLRAKRREFTARVVVAQKVLSNVLGYVEGVALLLGISEAELDGVRREGLVAGLRIVSASAAATVKDCASKLAPVEGALRRLLNDSAGIGQGQDPS